MTKKINNNSLRLLVSNSLFRGWKLIFKIFLNIYLWKETHNLQLLALFNIVFLIAHIFWFIVTSFYVKLWYRKIINTISYFWVILCYLLVIIFLEHIINNIYFIWILFWLFNGSYYVNYNVNQFDLTTFKNRWNFEWIKKVLITTSKIIFPWIIWAIIWFYNIKLAFLFWILIYIISYFIWNIQIIHKKWKINFKDFLAKIIKNKKIVYSLIWSFFFTLSFSLMLLDLLIPLLIFDELGTEIKLWFSLSFLSVLSIVIIYLFWRFIDYKHYNKFLIIFTILYIAWLFWITTFDSYSYLLLFSTIILSVISLYELGISVITNNSLHTLKEYNNYKVEFLVFKDLAYILWWITSFLLMYFSTDLAKTSIWFIFYSLMFFSVVTTLFFLKINMHEIEE